MIIVKGRELLIPENERYIGTTYDDNSTVRTFRIPRFHEDGMDKSQLDFYVIINYDDDSDPDAVGVVKAVNDDYIVLEWDVGEDVTEHSGCLYLWVRGFDHTGTVRWSSFPGVFYIEGSGTEPTDLSDLEERISEEDKLIRLAKLYKSQPMTAATAAEMIDREQIYVYVGDEEGYQYGHWYFWDGSAWVPGGVYNSIGLQTDKELIAEDVAADAKAVGDKFTDLKNEIADKFALVNVKGNTPYIADIFWRNVYGHFYTYASPPSEKIWSEIQGITTTDDTVIASFMPGDYYDNQSGNTDNRVNYVRLREFSKSTGALIRESGDLLLYHANSLSYDAESGKIYASAARNTETSAYISTICVVDYATFTVDGYHDVSGPEYIQSVSYDPTTGLMGFGRWVCYFIDKDTWTLTRSLQLSNPLVRAHGSTQGAKHDDKHIYVSTYYPNAIIVYTIDGEFVKTFRNDREDRWEQEDIAIDNGVCWIAAHKRYYDRNSLGEAHEDIPTIYRFNLDGSTLPKTLYEAVIDDYVLHVDTTTTNTIQDGTSAYPCKSLMEAIWISDSTESIEHTIRITASSVCRWLRLKRKTVRLEFQGATLAANCLIVQSNVYIQGAVIADVSGVSPYPYSSEGDVYISNGSSVTMGGCTVTAEKRISIYRSTVVAPDIVFSNTSGVTWCSNGAKLSAEYVTMRTPKIKVTGNGTSFYQILNNPDLSTIKTHSVNNEVTFSIQIAFTDEENYNRTASFVYTVTAGDATSVIELYIPFSLLNGKVYVAHFSYIFGDTELALTLDVIYNRQNLGGTIKSYKFNVKRYSV